MSDIFATCGRTECVAEQVRLDAKVAELEAKINGVEGRQKTSKRQQFSDMQAKCGSLEEQLEKAHSDFDALYTRNVDIEYRLANASKDLAVQRKQALVQADLVVDQESRIAALEARCEAARKILEPLVDCDPDIREWLGLPRWTGT